VRRLPRREEWPWSSAAFARDTRIGEYAQPMKKLPLADSTNDDRRKNVSDDYARAVSAPGAGCCCSPVPKGVVAKLAGYTDDQIAALPAEAVTNSFGCGNPLAFSGVKPGDVVLDLGSGAGIDLLLAAKKVGRAGKVIGVDMTDAMIEKARENIRAAGLSNVEVKKGIIEDLPVEAGSVDWVISNCVINLSPEKPRVFAEIARVLRPGGRMLVSDIVAEGLPAEISANRHLYSSCLAGAMSEKDYLAGLRQAGLTGVEVKERIVYDSTALEAFIGSELSEAGGCCGSAPVGDLAKEWAPRLEGKIASVKVAATKPAA
jgi:arsenite methyltransferase